MIHCDKPEYEIYQYGTSELVNLEKPSKSDIQQGFEGLDFTEQQLKKEPHLLILDEINLAAHCKIVPLQKVLNLLRLIPKQTTVVLTGRNAPPEFIELADFVNVISDIKHPNQVVNTKGIQY